MDWRKQIEESLRYIVEYHNNLMKDPYFAKYLREYENVYTDLHGKRPVTELTEGFIRQFMRDLPKNEIALKTIWYVLHFIETSDMYTDLLPNEMQSILECISVVARWLKEDEKPFDCRKCRHIVTCKEAFSRKECQLYEPLP